jgi:hypothetical protein
VTCHRLEEDDLLAGLGEARDAHVEHCPDCSARAQGYRRIAGWIADGRTPHRPPADWQRRTLAHVLATQGQVRSIPTDSIPADSIPTDATGPAAAGDEDRAASTPRRPRWSRVVLPVVLPIASAAIVVWIAWGALRGAPQPPRVAIESGERATSPGAVPAQSPRREGDPRPAPESVVQSTKRGGPVIVDWPSESDALDAGAVQGGHVRFDPPTGSFAGLSVDEIRRVIEAREDVYRACYQEALRQVPELRGTLHVHIQIDGDGRVQAVDTAPAGATLHSDAVAHCVSDAVQRLRFPAKGGIATVDYVFEFTQ